jgi:DNA excision repair protein ERCC-2
MALYFRHDSVRPHQKELMEDMQDAIAGHRIFMANAPTGLGKTDASIAAALGYALENEKTVFFLTPKISQHKIAIDVVNGIARKNSLSVRAVDMIGRSHCCIDENLLTLDNESFHTACGRKRQKQQCMFYENARGYGRVGEAKAESRFRVMLESYGSGRGHHELVLQGREKQCCPYEWLLRLAEISNVIVADYYHFMIPQIRDIFLMKVKKRVEDSIVIVDEAHNLAPRIRSSLSRSINTFTFARMSKEMRHLGMDAGPVEEEFSKWGSEMLGDGKEKRIAMDDFLSFIGRFGLAYDEAIKRLEDAGQAFIEKTSRKSACIRLARFMAEWRSDEPGCVRVIKRLGGTFYLSRRMLDPSAATGILNHTAASVLMSGSLSPMEMHRDVLGLDEERTVMRSYPSPFDPARAVNIIAENLTTRYSKRDLEGYMAIASKLDAVIARTPGGTAVFFPSYEVMNKVLPHVLSRNLHVQKPGMKPADVRMLIRDFKKGGILCGVQGGSLSEGVDYADGEIRTVVIVGVALEEMGVESKALIEYYEEKFGRGWDYGYLYPGTVKALQAAGRARRKESDRVAVVYMDERFTWRKYNWILNREERIVVTSNPEDEVGDFWKNQAD